MARRRAQWTKYQDRIDPARLVFIDETWTKTNMAPLRGWAPVGQRIKAKVPNGHWKTMTFLAALRQDRVEAPWLIDGPINGERFLVYVEKVLMPTLKPGDIVVMDNLGPQKTNAGRGARGRAGPRLFFLPKTHPTSIRSNSSSPSSSTGSERPQGAPSKPSATPSAKFSTASHPSSAQTTSQTQAMTESNLIPL